MRNLLIAVAVLVVPSFGFAQDRCAKCDGSGTITERCTRCGGTGVEEEYVVRGGGVVRYGCEGCGGWRGDGIYTGRQGTGVRSARCVACDGTGESTEKVAARRERQRAAAEAYRRKMEEEARRRIEERERELRELNDKLRRELKTASGGELKLKTGDLADPRQTLFGKSRDTGRGFKIQSTVSVRLGELRINDHAFEQLRVACYLTEKAVARGKEDEEAKFLRDQATKAMKGERLDVAVPPPARTPTVTQRINDLKELAVAAAIDESLADYLLEQWKALETQLKQLTQDMVLALGELQKLREGIPRDAKDKAALEARLKEMEEEILQTGGKWIRLGLEHGSAIKLAMAHLEELEGFLTKNSDIPILKAKEDSARKPAEIAKGCQCKGDGCNCLGSSTLCGGVRGCSCASQATDCSCSRKICKFAGTDWCCPGSHQDGDQQRCQTTCQCKYAQGSCGCSVSCNCPKRK